MGHWARICRSRGATSRRRWAGFGALVVALFVLLGPAVGTALAGQAAAITATEGAPFSGVVDTVSCPSTGWIANPMINWGDGTAASQGTVASASSGTCTISGEHTYTGTGSYTTTVTYSMGSDIGSASVADASLSPGPGNGLAGSAGTAVSGVVATFSDAYSGDPADDYSATIDWGDGSSGAGTVNGGYTVTGSNAYAYGGTYSITVTIRDNGGATTVVHSSATITGCPKAAPSAPAPSYHPPASGPDARFIAALFHDLLGRPASSGEISAFEAALGAGASRYQVALSILRSPEYRQDLTRQLYSAYLGQPPDSAAETFFSGQLHSGASDEAVSAAILGSEPFFSGPGNNSTDAFLGALYCTTLFRAMDHTAQVKWETALGGGANRAAVASSVIDSDEAVRQRVSGYYLRFLRRAAAPGELKHFLNRMHSGGRDEQVIASLVSSQAYYRLFNPTNKFATTISALGTIHTVLPQRARISLTVLHIISAARVTTVAPVVAPRTRRVGGVDFGVHRKGNVTLHWNREVRGRHLARGSYVLLLRAYKGRRLILTSDALPFKVH